jgi:hypothetical protein
MLPCTQALLILYAEHVPRGTRSHFAEVCKPAWLFVAARRCGIMATGSARPLDALNLGSWTYQLGAAAPMGPMLWSNLGYRGRRVALQQALAVSRRSWSTRDRTRVSQPPGRAGIGGWAQER